MTHKVMGGSTLAWLAGLASMAAATMALNAVPLDVDSFNGKRVMFITAHPDDIEGFAGGLVATLGLDANRSVEIAYLIITSGNAGGKCYDNSTKPPLPPSAFFECEKEDLAAVRRKESIQAAQFLGVHKVFRIGVDDGMSVAVHETRIRRAITAYIRTFKPHVVFTHGPNPDFDAPPTCNGACPAPKGWDDLGFHPDHQHVGTLVFNSVYGGGSAADNNLVFQDLDVAGVPGWRVEQLYFFALTARPMTHFFELDKDSLDKKIAASNLHRSQYQDAAPVDTFTWVAEQIGSVNDVSYAEGYQGWF